MFRGRPQSLQQQIHLESTHVHTYTSAQRTEEVCLSVVRAALKRFPEAPVGGGSLPGALLLLLTDRNDNNVPG